MMELLNCRLLSFTRVYSHSGWFINSILFTVAAKMSYQKIYVPSKWLLNFDKYGYGGHVDIK